MTIARALPVLCLSAAVALVAGCKADRLDETKTFTLKLGEEGEKVFDLGKQSKEQKVTADYTSTESEVSVFVVAAKDYDAFDTALTGAKKKEKAMAAALDSKSGTVAATVPPNTEYKVVVALGDKATKPTDVKLHMTNRK